MNQHIRVRIRESGQILDMVPDVAMAMICGGTAERVPTDGTTQPESMSVAPHAEHAVSQQSPARKPLFSKKAKN